MECYNWCGVEKVIHFYIVCRTDVDIDFKIGAEPKSQNNSISVCRTDFVIDATLGAGPKRQHISINFYRTDFDIDVKKLVRGLQNNETL